MADSAAKSMAAVASATTPSTADFMAELASPTLADPGSSDSSGYSFGHRYSSMMQRTLLNHFAAPGLEMAYRKYQIALWGERFRQWALLAAGIASGATVFVEVSHWTNSPRLPHESLRVVLIVFSILLWGLWLTANWVPRDWLHYFFRYQQLYLFLLSVAFQIAVTLPGYLHHEDDSDTSEVLGSDLFGQGHWAALMAAGCCIVVMWSDLSPVLYAVVSLLGLVLWNVRTVRIHTDTWPGGQVRFDVGTIAGYLAMYMCLWMATCFISYAKDTLLRQNFVVLQILREDKDRRIKALRGEKQQLEFLVAVNRAKQQQQQQSMALNIKFVDRDDEDAKANNGRAVRRLVERTRAAQNRKRPHHVSRHTPTSLNGGAQRGRPQRGTSATDSDKNQVVV